MNKLLNISGRLLIAQIFLIAGIGKIGSGYAASQGYMESMGIPGSLLPLVIFVEIGGALALMAGYRTKIAALALALFSVITALVFHSHFSEGALARKIAVSLEILPMKSCLSVLLMLFLVCAVGKAVAADWWFVPWERKGESEEIVYVDKSSMERISRGSRIIAWVWTVYRNDRSSEFGNYRSDKHRLTVDCEKKEAGADAGTLYSAYGGLVHQYRKAAPEMAPIAPDSIRETTVAFICSGGKQPPRSIPVYDPSRDFEQRFLQRERERKPVEDLAPKNK